MAAVIREAQLSEDEDGRDHPRVGALLADNAGNVIRQAHRGAGGPGRHAEFALLEGCAHLDVAHAHLFVTLEPCTQRSREKTPCAERIVAAGVRSVYIGMLDPNPLICGRGETYLRMHGVTVERFPSEQIAQIERINSAFIRRFESAHLPHDSLYVQKQIPDLIRDHLARAGLSVDEVPLEWGLTLSDITAFCASQLGQVHRDRLAQLIRDARGFAFDAKYVKYTYDADARKFGDYRREVHSILHDLHVDDFSTRRVIDVGIGNGIEGRGFLEQVAALTLVDVAPDSLSHARALLPTASIILAEAERLNGVPSVSQDLYISLRTYQSSYFEIGPAVREAYRVVRQGGAVIISIANAFVGAGDVVIRGLLYPRSDVANKDRPFELAEQIRQHLTRLRFEEVGIRTGLAEVYVYGRRAR